MYIVRSLIRSCCNGRKKYEMGVECCLVKVAICYSTKVNSLYAMGTFMCPRNASTLHDGHIYVPSDPVHLVHLGRYLRGCYMHRAAATAVLRLL